MWSHRQREMHFTQHALCSWSLLSSPHSPLLLKRPTHMRASTVARISPPTAPSRGCFGAAQTDKQANSSGEPVHPTGADQPSSAGCCSLSALVCTSSESGCATSGSDPARQPPRLHSPERLMSSQSVEQSRRCRGLLMEPPDTSWLDPSLPDSTDPVLISFNLPIFSSQAAVECAALPCQHVFHNVYSSYNLQFPPVSPLGIETVLNFH